MTQNPWQIFTPRTETELTAYRDFRWRHLRAPWGQAPDPAYAQSELRSDHLAARDANGTIIASGRLVWGRPGEAQIRAMAVAEEWRGHGLGLAMLRELEARAKGRGVERITLHARETALGFYAKAGYSDCGPGELLFGQIPHRWMETTLDCGDFRAFGLSRRPACDADGPAISELVFGVLAAYGMAPEHDGIDQDLAAIESTYAGGFFDVLEDKQGQLIATVAILRRDTHRGELRRMYLRPDARGRGIGRACLGHALVWARKAGLRELELETATALSEARALYEWAGFRLTDEGECEARRCDLRMVLRKF